MSLKKGKNSFLYNVTKLLSGRAGKTRSKAIKTIAKKRGISSKEAKKVQAVAISKNLSN